MDYLGTQLHSRKINEEQLYKMCGRRGSLSATETGRLMKYCRMFLSLKGGSCYEKKKIIKTKVQK